MFSLHIWISTFCLHFTLPSFFRDQVSGTEFRGPNSGDRIPGTEFRGPDFGDWILGAGFQKEAKSNQFFLNFELCSLYISLVISIYRHFYFLSSFDIKFLFQGLGFRYWILGTGFQKEAKSNQFY